MAKKATSDINMSEEIRNLLRENRTLGMTEALTALSEKFPRERLNKNSFAVAFYSARHKLGIKSGRRTKKAKGRTVVMKRPSTAVAVDLDSLKAAAKFVAEVGSAEAAIAAIQQVRTLQIR